MSLAPTQPGVRQGTAAPRAEDIAQLADALLAEAARRPNDLTPRRRLAGLYQSAGWRLDEARQWEAILEIAPADGEARERLKRLSSVVEIVREAADANPPTVQLSIQRQAVIITMSGVASPCTDDGPSGHFQQQHAYITRLIDCGFRGFIIELSGVTFMGSHFLSALVMWARTVTSRGGRLMVCGLRPELRNVMRVTRLVHVVRCCATLDEAVALLDAPPTR
jgi:anti-anti-sigma factor